MIEADIAKNTLFSVTLFEDHGIKVDRAERLSLSIYSFVLLLLLRVSCYICNEPLQNLGRGLLQRKTGFSPSKFLLTVPTGCFCCGLL